MDKLKMENLNREGYLKIKYDGGTHQRLGGALVWADSLLSMYYMNNPNIYANYIVESNDITNIEIATYSALDTVGITNQTLNGIISNTTTFRQQLNAGNLGSKEIYLYVYYNQQKDSAKAYRFFMNYLIFGMFQMIAAIFAFNIRNTKYDWETDMKGLFYFEAFANPSVFSNLVIWLLITFSTDFDYFIYSSTHKILHLISFLFSVINTGIKLYLLLISFNDYFSSIPMYKPKKVKSE